MSGPHPSSFAAVRGGMAEASRDSVPMVILTVSCVIVIIASIFGGAHGIHYVLTQHTVAAIVTVVALFGSMKWRTERVAREFRLELRVGAEGILAAAKNRASSFHKYSDVRDVRRHRRDVVIELTSGETVRYGVAGAGSASVDFGEREIAGLLTRVEAARAAYARSGGTAAVAAVLARGDREVPAWRASLVSLLDDPTTYRARAVPRETLWRVLEDPTASDTARAGAAVALRGTLDDEARRRLRVATASCASAPLRGTFEATLEAPSDAPDEHAPIDRALAAFTRDAR